MLASACGIALFVVVSASALVSSGHADFDLYYYGGRAERAGSYTDTDRVLRLADREHANPTRNDVFGAPTLVALVFQPLSFLGRVAALRVWLVASCALLLVALVLAAPRAPGLWAGGYALVVGFHVALRLGQASIVMAALLILTWAFLQRDRAAPAGACLAVAIAFKLFPLFLLVPLVAHRRWDALRAVAVTLAVLAVGTVLTLGVGDVGAAIRGTLDTASYVYPAHQNLSVPGIVLRATDSEALAKATTIVLTFVAGYWLLRNRLSTVAATFAFGVVLMLGVQSIAWDHYFPMAVVAFLALATAWRRDGDATRAPALVAAAAVAYVLVVQTEPVSWLGTKGAIAFVNAPATIGAALVGGLLLRTDRAAAP
jgi:hypothetical protein